MGNQGGNMTCYHPLIRYETWKRYKKIDGHEAYEAKVQKPDPNYKQEYDNIEEYAKSIRATGRYRNVQAIPCGKCIGCRLEYSKDWATKGIFEAEQWKDNWFLTITYDNEHLPEAAPAINEETGEEMEPNPGGTLKPTDITNFMKRLRTHYERKYNHTGIRFMACGEYGSGTGRAHYHAICFNLPIQQKNMSFHEYNENYEALWRCPELEEIWRKGMIVAAEVNWNTCAYVARYITKKIGMPADKEHYKNLGLEPEFFRMSRRPGIGRQYYEDHKEELYKTDQVLIKKYGGGILKAKPPKYYDRLYDIENPERMEEIKKERKKKAEIISKNKFNQTTLYKKQQLNVEEETKQTKAKELKRTKI